LKTATWAEFSVMEKKPEPLLVFQRFSLGAQVPNPTSGLEGLNLLLHGHRLCKAFKKS
jgi:hypothetical protein